MVWGCGAALNYKIEKTPAIRLFLSVRFFFPSSLSSRRICFPWRTPFAHPPLAASCEESQSPCEAKNPFGGLILPNSVAMESTLIAGAAGCAGRVCGA